MVQGFLQAVHGADGHFIVHEFSAETVRAGGAYQRIHVFQHGEGPLVGIDGHVLGCQRRAEGRKVLQARAVHDQAVQGVADAHAPRFRIENDGLAHLQVACRVEIRVHHAGAGFDAGDAGVVADKVDEPAAAARDDDVDVADGVQQRGTIATAARLDASASFPPFSTQAFPLLKQSENTSSVTFGRAS